MEKWLPIPEFPGYEVSNMGRVRSHRHAYRRGHELQLPPKILKFGKHMKRGTLRYFKVCLRKDGANHTLYVHHLVAKVFIGPPPVGTFVLHKNDVGTDNHHENLYYGSHAQNMRDAVQNGRCIGQKSWRHVDTC